MIKFPQCPNIHACRFFSLELDGGERSVSFSDHFVQAAGDHWMKR